MNSNIKKYLADGGVSIVFYIDMRFLEGNKANVEDILKRGYV